MHQLIQLAGEVHRQRLAPARQQRPAQRLLALRQDTRRAERQARRLRVDHAALVTPSTAPAHSTPSRASASANSTH